MPQGDYRPKFKVGETVIAPGHTDDLEYIVMFTYLSIKPYSPFYRDRGCPPEYNESDSSSVIYCLLERENEGGGKYNQSTWITENKLQLYCNNSERGKRILLQPKNINNISEWFAITGNDLERYIALLQQPST